MARELGSVAMFTEGKGFGFIKPDKGGKDVFVHHSAISSSGNGFRSLQKGNRVEYEAVEDKKGLRAINVVRLA